MALQLFFHPFSSYGQEALIALYENATPFEPLVVGGADPSVAQRWAQLWPMKKFPVLTDGERTVFEATCIVEHLDLFHRGPVRLISADPKAALEVRMLNRFFDNYVYAPQQKTVYDALRAQADRDPKPRGQWPVLGSGDADDGVGVQRLRAQRQIGQLQADGEADDTVHEQLLWMQHADRAELQHQLQRRAPHAPRQLASQDDLHVVVGADAQAPSRMGRVELAAATNASDTWSMGAATSGSSSCARGVGRMRLPSRTSSGSSSTHRGGHATSPPADPR